MRRPACYPPAMHVELDVRDTTAVPCVCGVRTAAANISKDELALVFAKGSELAQSVSCASMCAHERYHRGPAQFPYVAMNQYLDGEDLITRIDDDLVQLEVKLFCESDKGPA